MKAVGKVMRATEKVMRAPDKIIRAAENIMRAPDNFLNVSDSAGTAPEKIPGVSDIAGRRSGNCYCPRESASFPAKTHISVIAVLTGRPWGLNFVGLGPRG